MHDQGHAPRHADLFQQFPQVGAVFHEPVRAGAGVVQLLRIALADQVGGDTAPEVGHVRDDVAPEVRRRGVAVQEHDRVTLTDLHVGHPLSVDGGESLVDRVLSCGRGHTGGP